MVLFKINKQDVLQPQVESSSKSPGRPEQVRSNPPVSSTQPAPPRRTSTLTWSSSDDRRSMEAAALKVRFPRSQLLQARTEQILGASMVRRSRDGLVLAGQFWSQQKSGTSQSKTHALQEDSDEDSSRCWCRLGLVEDDDNIEHYVDEAKRSSDWRDKLWVSIEVPHATPVAGWVRLTRLLLTFLALSMVMMESNPAFNKYGESTIACRLVVNQYCRWVSTCEADGNCPDQAIANASNPACFADPTTGYGGCAGELSAAQISQCAFPAVEL